MICSSVRIVRFIVHPFLGSDPSRSWRKNPGAGQQVTIGERCRATLVEAIERVTALTVANRLSEALLQW
jgi:hypothetical protein